MIAIAVEVRPGRPQQRVIFIEGEPWRTIDTTVMGRRLSLPSSYPSLDAWTHRFAEIEHQAAKSYALRQLARRELSSFELQQILQHKLVSSPIIDQVITELSTSGYVNDDDWIQRFIAFQSARSQGPDAIRHKLRQKGLPEEQIEAALRPLQTESIQEAIQKLLQTRYRSRDLSDYRERQKVVAALARRGFCLDDIFAVMHS